MADFNKDEYWKNRKSGLRGQGPKENHKIEANTFSNRTQYRKKVHDGKYTTKHLTYQRTEAETAAIQARVKRKEAGEKERINSKYSLNQAK